MDSLVQGIKELKNANDQIVDSIQTISEEVSAHANQTADAEEKNAMVIDNMDSKMHKLILYITQGNKKTK